MKELSKSEKATLATAFRWVHNAVQEARRIADAHDDIELYGLVDQFESKCMAAVSSLRSELKVYDWK